MIFRSFYYCNAHYITVLFNRGQGDHITTRREKMTIKDQLEFYLSEDPCVQDDACFL